MLIVHTVLFFSGDIDMFSLGYRTAEEYESRGWYRSPIHDTSAIGFFVKVLDISDMGESNWIMNPRLLVFEAFHWNMWLAMAFITLTVFCLKSLSSMILCHAMPS